MLDTECFPTCRTRSRSGCSAGRSREPATGQVELGKLEAFYEAMRESLDAYALPADVEPMLKFAKFRRTLAGALVTVARDKITVEPAPPRRAGLRK